MKQNKIFIFSIFLAILIILFIFLNQQNENPKVCFEENCFLVELSKTQAEKARGLMFKESLEEDEGMLFIYDEEGIYSFWMKNTLISLDIIWINSRKEVVYIEHEALPCNEECENLIPSENAQFVLEIKAGTAEKLNIILGDEIKFYNIKK